MRRLILLTIVTALSLSCAPWAAAEEITSSAPSLPDFSGAGTTMDLPLPSLDLPGLAPQSTPVPAASSAAPATPVAPAALTAPAEAAPTATSVPEAAPTAVPQESAPTAVPETNPTTSASASTEPTNVSGADLKGLEAYFPIRAGARWSYRSPVGKIRTVECLSRDGEGASLSGSFRVTTGEVPLTQTWRLSGGKVVLGTALTTLRVGWVRLVAPQGKTIPRWTYDRHDGVVSYYKQEAGPLQAGGKKYLEGLTVTERTLKGSRQVSLRKWYYAKGIGLVAEAVFDTTGATLPDQSFELAAPAAADSPVGTK